MFEPSHGELPKASIYDVELSSVCYANTDKLVLESKLMRYSSKHSIKAVSTGDIGFIPF